MDVAYASIFVRMLKTLPEALQDEAIEKIGLFQDVKNHKHLKVHKLTGRLKDRYAFSVNYTTRIVFSYQKTRPKSALLLAIGDHDVYKR